MRTRKAVAGLLASLGLLIAACGTEKTGGIAIAPPGSPTQTSPSPQAAATVSEQKPPSDKDNVVIGNTKSLSGLHIALTFDDGPDPAWTPQVLDLLDQYHI